MISSSASSLIFKSKLPKFDAGSLNLTVVACIWREDVSVRCELMLSYRYLLAAVPI